MIKKKDYELIAEAYELIMEKAMPCTCTCESCKDEDCKKCSCKKCDCKGCKCSKTESLDECWEKMSAPQKAAVEKILHTSKGYKVGDHAWNEDKKTVALSHELGEDVERDIIIDSEGKEIGAPIHSGMHKESKDSIASHATLDPRELISAAANNPHDPFIHGRLSGYRHKVEGRGEGIVPSNPHKDGAAQDWQRGFDSILAKDDKVGKKEVEDGEVHTAAQDAAGTVEESAETLDEKKKMACGKGCMCGKCPKCKPKKKTLEQIAEEVIEEANKK